MTEPPTRDDAHDANPTTHEDAVVTRSEEELRITTHRRETQRARMIRYAETETVTRTVEVRHDQVRIEYEPISPHDSTRPPVTGSGDSGGRWIILYDEEVVLTTRRVPRERVRLRTQSVTEDREISEVLRKEHIELEDEDLGR
jgi:uncharacterized protein (TIGR02271 family)